MQRVYTFECVVMDRNNQRDRDTDTGTQAKSTRDNNNFKKCANQKKIAHEQFYGVFKKHAPNHGCLFKGIVQRYKKNNSVF